MCKTPKPFATVSTPVNSVHNREFTGYVYFMGMGYNPQNPLKP